MNMPLLKLMLRTNAKGIFNYAAGSAFYILLMIWLYPSIADNTDAIDELMQAMPEGLGNAFGLNGGFGSAEAFISGEYYGLILVLILSIVTVQLSTAMMARLVDRGSMAYLLSAPATRRQVALTQAFVLALSLLIIMTVTTLAGFAGKALFLGDQYPFDGARFLKMNLVAYLLFFAVGGLCFLISAISDDEKKAFGWSGALAFGFFSLDLIAKISGKLEGLRFLTLFTLYRPGDIITGEAGVTTVSAVLLCTGLAGYLLGAELFRRRDLPL